MIAQKGIAVDDFVAATKDLCCLPSFFNAPLFQRILQMYGPDAGTREV